MGARSQVQPEDVFAWRAQPSLPALAAVYLLGSRSTP
jgi:hypothetical protein